MAEQTPNYGLTKPDLEEFYDVEVQNSNMDIIDTTLKGLDEGKATSADLTSLEQTVTEHLAEFTQHKEKDIQSHNGFIGREKPLVGLTDFNTFRKPGKYHGVLAQSVANEPIPGGTNVRRIAFEVTEDSTDSPDMAQTVTYLDGFGKGKKFFRYGTDGWLKDVTVNDFNTAIGSDKGYATLPNGLIEQWIQVICNSNGKVVTYPVTFPNAVLSVELSILSASAGHTTYFNSLTNHQLNVYCSSEQIVHIRVLGW